LPAPRRGHPPGLDARCEQRILRADRPCHRHRRRAPRRPTPRKEEPVMRRLMTALAVVTVGLATLAVPAAPAGAAPSTTITLVTHDSFAASKSVMAKFTKQTGVKVKILQQGDAGAALNQAILTKDHPLGDVFFGVDNTFLGRALDAGIFVPYAAKDL